MIYEFLGSRPIRWIEERIVRHARIAGWIFFVVSVIALWLVAYWIGHENGVTAELFWIFSAFICGLGWSHHYEKAAKRQKDFDALQRRHDALIDRYRLLEERYDARAKEYIGQLVRDRPDQVT